MPSFDPKDASLFLRRVWTRPRKTLASPVFRLFKHWREYNKAKAANNDTHLSWAAFIQFLDDLCVGTSPTLHDKQKALSEFDFLEVGKKTNKNLVQTIEKFLTIYHDISGDLTPVSRVYAIMHALRNIPSLVADLSTDPVTNEPYSDPDSVVGRDIPG